jgi:hypothetical protein
LNAIEELGAERFERPLASVAGAALARREGARRDQRHERKGQHHGRYRHIPERDEKKNRERRQYRDR